MCVMLSERPCHHSKQLPNNKVRYKKGAAVLRQLL